MTPLCGAVFGLASETLKFPASRSTAAEPVCGYQKMPPLRGGICVYLLKSLESPLPRDGGLIRGVWVSVR